MADLHRMSAILTKLSSLLAIAGRSLARIAHVAGVAQSLRTDRHGSVGTGFAEIWRNAQRRRSEYLSSLGRQFLPETRPPNSIRAGTGMTSRRATPQSEHAYLAIDSKSGVAADGPSNVPGRNGLAA